MFVCAYAYCITQSLSVLFIIKSPHILFLAYAATNDGAVVGAAIGGAVVGAIAGAISVAVIIFIHSYKKKIKKV